MKTIYLDPDFRANPDTSKDYCVRCQKPIKNIKNAIKVTVDWNNWTVIKGGNELIGLECWKQITKENDMKTLEDLCRPKDRPQEVYLVMSPYALENKVMGVFLTAREAQDFIESSVNPKLFEIVEHELRGE